MAAKEPKRDPVHIKALIEKYRKAKAKKEARQFIAEATLMNRIKRRKEKDK